MPTRKRKTTNKNTKASPATQHTTRKHSKPSTAQGKNSPATTQTTEKGIKKARHKRTRKKGEKRGGKREGVEGIAQHPGRQMKRKAHSIG